MSKAARGYRHGVWSLRVTARLRSGRWSARVSIAPRRRATFKLPTCAGEEDASKAKARAKVLVQLADKMRGAEIPEYTMRDLLERAAGRDGPAHEAVVEAVDRLCRGEASLPVSGAMTVRQFGELWTSGELHRRFPDHVKRKKSARDDRDRLEKYVYPVIGDMPIPQVTVEHGDAVLNKLPRRLAPATRRHVGQALSKLFKLAAYPARIIPASPLPEGFLPKLGGRKAFGFLYPDEDRALLACSRVPLEYRLVYGFICREGTRRGEAAALTWDALDFDHGAIRLDENKTNDPRTWALDESVARALRCWRRFGERDGWVDETIAGAGGGLVFRGLLTSKDRGAAGRLREHLRTAGVERAELFERSESRRPLRIHDLRATFVTLSLASGKPEAWVADRTGHRSSTMINRYRRQARSVAELGLGELDPLDQAIPELAGGSHG